MQLGSPMGMKKLKTKSGCGSSIEEPLVTQPAQKSSKQATEPSWTVLPQSYSKPSASGALLRPLLLAGTTSTRSKAPENGPSMGGNLVSQVTGSYISTGLMPHPIKGLAKRRFTASQLQSAASSLTHKRIQW